MEDEKGEDDKILAVPIGDPRFQEINEVDDLAHHLKAEITDFFLSYKHLEPRKWVRVKRWKDAKSAEALIVAAINEFDRQLKAGTDGEDYGLLT